MMDTHEGRKTSWRRTGRRVVLATSWLNKVQEDANALLISMLWRSKIARGHGAAQRFIRTIRDDDDDDDDDEGCKTCVNNGG